MLSTSNRLRWTGAVLVLAAGTTWAGVLVSTPPPDRGPDDAALRALAARLRQPEQEPLIPEVPAASPAVLVRPVPEDGTEGAAPVPPDAALPESHPAQSHPPSRTDAADSPSANRPTQAAARTIADDPVKSIALLGITHENDSDRAWLVDVSTQDREAAGAGESALGFIVRAIGADSVRITRGAGEYVLRLGQKQIPLAAGESAGAGSAGDETAGPDEPGPGAFGAPGGFSALGGLGRRGGGGFGGLGARFGGGGAGANGGGGGGGTATAGSDSPMILGAGPRLFGGGAALPNNPGGGNQGGFGGGGGASFGGGLGATSQLARSSGSTSNPQTARRSGARLVADAKSQPSPQAISNPQTQRRLGTTTGPAFGQSSGTVASISASTRSGTASSQSQTGAAPGSGSSSSTQSGAGR